MCDQAERDDHARAGLAQVGGKIRVAALDLFGLGLVVRRQALDGVADAAIVERQIITAIG